MKRNSSQREYKDYVVDIADSIEKIETFIVGFDFESFREDEKTVFAVVRALEIIGEAVTRIPGEVRLRHKEIPWQDITDMRNKLIHEYFGANKAVVWKTICEDIPALKRKMSDLLDELKIKRLF